jgi:hypothetical protein
MGEKIRRIERWLSQSDLTSVEMYVLRCHLHLGVSKEAKARYRNLKPMNFFRALERALEKATAA